MAFDQEEYQGSKNQGGEGGDTNYGVHEGEIVVTRTGLNPNGAAGDLPILPMRAHPGDEVLAAHELLTTRGLESADRLRYSIPKG